MKYLLVALLGYLLGTSSMAYYISLFKGVDLKKEGTGNLGASNTVVVLGKMAGVLVLIHDLLKAMLAVLIARYLFPDLLFADVLAGACCILGHIFPFYLHFKGGKGFASYVGMAAMLDIKFTLIMCAIIIILVLITDYIVVGTTLCMIAVPVYMAINMQNVYVLLILAVPSLVMVFKHIENYKRIYHGTEIGLRRANKGVDRVK